MDRPRPACLPAFATAIERTYASGVVEMYHQCVYNHSNGVVLVGLAPSHPALQGTRRVVAVRFDGGKRDVSKSEVKGKRKRGGMFMGAHDRLCDVDCDDGTSYTLRACVRGHLVEVNERLAAEPELIASPRGDSYVAVFIPKEGDRITGDKAVIQVRLLAQLEADRLERESTLEKEKGRKSERDAKRAAYEASPPAVAAAAAAAAAATPPVPAVGAAATPDPAAASVPGMTPLIPSWVPLDPARKGQAACDRQ
mmetsp:Transcript_45748/g.106897  ORF Transcript_45748/g.106897 Transcript_45748/m.106897 type:complete len:253 (-) Transcript_45748:2033-2791(-)